jgi:integrase
MRKADPARRFLFPGDRPDAHLVGIKRGWAKITTAAGLADFHFHDLRHVFGNTLSDAGVPLAMLGALLGHSNSRTTERYARVKSVEVLAEASEQIGKFLPAPEVAVEADDKHGDRGSMAVC